MSKCLPTISAGSFSITLAQHLLDLLAWHGQPSEPILAAADLTAEQLVDLNGWLSIGAGQKMLHAVLEISRDPFLFLKLSKVAFPAGFGLLGQIVQVCPTLEDVILAVSRFEALISDIGFSALKHEPGRALWCFECRVEDPVMARHVEEFIMGCRYIFMRLVREDRSNVVAAVHFQHACPAVPEADKHYERVFRCPVYFGQPETALILKPQALKLPLRQVDASLKALIEAQAQKKLSERQTALSFLDQVRLQLRAQLQSGYSSRELLAQNLNMSSRHLHRQLQQEGSTYRAILEELRLEMAQHYMQTPALPISEISRLLGFSNRQSLVRWFRQTTGYTPSDYRQREGIRQQDSGDSPL